MIPNDHKTGPDVFEQTVSRQRLAKMLMRLFDHWQLDESAKLELLGLPATSHRRLPEFAAGRTPLPNTRDLRDRTAYLLAIHQGLRLLYPENPDLRYGWVHRRNRVFDNLRPIEVMREQGLIGVARMAHCIENQCN